jgi:eukaryotic-like serine/threonine-protein kinase
MDTDDPLYRQAARRLGSVLCGKYTVDRILGVGGMAVVYAATHRNQKQVAIKMLHAELSLHEDIRKRFLREGYVANSVKHRGAVDVIDDDVAEDGAAFIVMELLDGAPLDKIVGDRGGRLDAQATLAVGYELCSVLSAAHEGGVVHRDIKPANLFITLEGELKVLDFGIARLRDASSQNTGTGMMMGTPAFMAPEQARGKSDEVGAASDIWAIGATLFNLLTNNNVHEGETVQLVVIQAATQPARSLATVSPQLPSEIVRVVDRALMFERKDRWESAAAMKAALKEAHVALFGAMSPARTLAGLVGGDVGGGSERPPPADIATAPTIGMPITPSARSTDTPASAPAAKAASIGQTTAAPVSATAFVTPIASKRSLAIGVGALALVATIGVAAALRSSKADAPPAAGLTPIPVSSATPASKTDEPAAPSVAPAPSSSVATSAMLSANGSSAPPSTQPSTPQASRPLTKPGAIASGAPRATASASITGGAVPSAAPSSVRTATAPKLDPGSIR